MPPAAVPYRKSLPAKNYLTIPPRNVRVNLTSGDFARPGTGDPVIANRYSTFRRMDTAFYLATNRRRK